MSAAGCPLLVIDTCLLLFERLSCGSLVLVLCPVAALFVLDEKETRGVSLFIDWA